MFENELLFFVWNLLTTTLNLKQETEYGIEYKGITAKKIIFCEGMHAAINPQFSWLPFVPSKGEILKVKIEDFTNEAILNKQVFIIPLENNTFRVGSTYKCEYESMPGTVFAVLPRHCISAIPLGKTKPRRKEG